MNEKTDLSSADILEKIGEYISENNIDLDEKNVSAKTFLKTINILVTQFNISLSTINISIAIASGKKPIEAFDKSIESISTQQEQFNDMLSSFRRDLEENND